MERNRRTKGLLKLIADNGTGAWWSCKLMRRYKQTRELLIQQYILILMTVFALMCIRLQIANIRFRCERRVTIAINFSSISLIHRLIGVTSGVTSDEINFVARLSLCPSDVLVPRFMCYRKCFPFYRIGQTAFLLTCSYFINASHNRHLVDYAFFLSSMLAGICGSSRSNSSRSSYRDYIYLP